MTGNRILVLDGQNINTLAIARELGRNEYYVGVTCNRRSGLTFFSRYSSKKYIVPGYRDKQLYVEEISRIALDDGYSMIIPVGLESYLAFSEFRDLVPESVRIPLPPAESMYIASCKDRTFDHAKGLGLAIPETLKVDSPHNGKIADFIDSTGFPIVVKGSICGVENIRYCNDMNELDNALSRLLKHEERVICQEYIRGDTHGFYTYYHNGRMYASFMHERMKEFPITGGPSAVAKSYRDNALVELSKKLLDSLDWNGPVMVEWKRDEKDGRYKLIEINPKLWGSLDLTIQSGVNIPLLMVRALMGKDIEQILDYSNTVFRWTFPSEALHFAATGFSREKIPDGYESKNNICGDDILPTVVQIGHFVVKLTILLIKGELRYPSGKPDLK